MPPAPRWDDPSLRVQSDPRGRARYRLLQGWYRETVLGLPPGADARGRLVGSLLTEEAGAAGRNFLSDDIARYVWRRIPEVQAAHGTIEVTRLRRNMLSSQPLCFNLFGKFRALPVEAAAVLRDALGIDIATIEKIEVEWAPRDGIGDRTAFDAFVEYRTRSGGMGFLGIETKYTEPFSREEYASDLYVKVTTGSGAFRDGAEEVLEGRDTNQLWRNTLLALQLRRTGYVAGHVVVMACSGDRAAERALRGVRSQLHAPDDLVRHVPLEVIVDHALKRPALVDWAVAFRRRYLDLAPVVTVTG